MNEVGSLTIVRQNSKHVINFHQAGLHQVSGSSMNVKIILNVLSLVEWMVILFSSKAHSIVYCRCSRNAQAQPLDSMLCGSDSSHMIQASPHAYTVPNYVEDTFTIPRNDSYDSYLLHKAPLLRYVYIEHNLKVTLIHIANCSLFAVPKTIRNVPNLINLVIKSCRVQHLDLNDMVHLTALYNVDLTNNQIVSIVEFPSGTVLPIYRLYLAGNKLRYLNANVLHALKELRCLVLDGNRIEELTSPIILPLVEEFSIRNNRLGRLNCTNWYLPSLKYFFCNNNRLTSAPIGWQSMWRIDRLDLSFNRLRSFRMDDIYLTQLRVLNLAANELTSVTTNQTHLRVPLERLQLAYNRLTVLDISRWGMPNLWRFDVNHNQLTELGDVFLRFPSLDTMMILSYNNWSCAWLKRVHPSDLRRRNYGCLSTNQSCPVGKLMVAENCWICCW